MQASGVIVEPQGIQQRRLFGFLQPFELRLFVHSRSGNVVVGLIETAGGHINIRHSVGGLKRERSSAIGTKMPGAL